jgi:hypothetical protein
MVERRQVNPHHQDQVSAALTGQACRQQPQLPRALHGQERSRAWSLAEMLRTCVLTVFTETDSSPAIS